MLQIDHLIQVAAQDRQEPLFLRIKAGGEVAVEIWRCAGFQNVEPLLEDFDLGIQMMVSFDFFVILGMDVNQLFDLQRLRIVLALKVNVFDPLLCQAVLELNQVTVCFVRVRSLLISLQLELFEHLILLLVHEFQLLDLLFFFFDRLFARLQQLLSFNVGFIGLFQPSQRIMESNILAMPIISA